LVLFDPERQFGSAGSSARATFCRTCPA